MTLMASITDNVASCADHGWVSTVVWPCPVDALPVGPPSSPDVH